MSAQPPSGVWEQVIGQPQAVATLSAAASEPDAMTHAWLLTGPPGSGRSVAARAFAAALQCPEHGCGHCRECRTALDGSHADVEVVATSGLSLTVERARELVALGSLRPSVGRWRVIIVEDADRLTEQGANALLKVIEEPVSRTVWLLCAPSLDDVIVTIRSRSRHVRLRTPPVEAVAELLTRRDGIDPAMARYAARAAQSHVGIAKRLATDEGARIRRRDTLALAGKIRGVGDALDAAADLASIATDESGSSTGERDAREREELLTRLGADPSARTQPPAVRAALAAQEKEQKQRATRFARDVVDRCLVDLMSIYRDALVLSLGTPVPLVNEDQLTLVQQLARTLPRERLLLCVEAIGEARERIDRNVAPLLALEAMCLSLRLPR
ncbi:DNA polymerase III subunit delta' [Arsenicicoccus piscis]|uniref:DNA polymerase III subunit delta' n=1 Tax=Arsenicicoccus piscis TaxID=673954 RepID=UPI001F4CB3DA|nr:DNA polymerase III subunit delta' [Arsenicicoccus piscis]MCH8627615.1 DNA polymerase III subunit delta' [Arsenicicoccus piscis]